MIKEIHFFDHSGSWGVQEEPSRRSSTLTFTRAELFALTGYRQSKKQLEVLHRRGFSRAYMGRHGVVLEHAHYIAVCAGKTQPEKPSLRPIVRKVRA